MAKFDLDKARKDAEAAITALKASIEKIEKGGEAKRDRLAKAKAAVEKIESDKAAKVAEIEDLEDFLAKTGPSDQTVAAEGVPSEATFGQF